VMPVLRCCALLLGITGQASAFSGAQPYSGARSGAGEDGEECGGQGSDGYIIQADNSLPFERLVEKLEGAEVSFNIRAINAIAVRGIGERILDKLKIDSKIKRVSANCIVRLDPMERLRDAPTDRRLSEAAPWGLDRIDSRGLNLDGSYSPKPGDGGKDAIIYILDTGIRTKHEDFENRAEPGWSAGCLGATRASCSPGWAFNGDIDDAVNVAEMMRFGEQCSGHGTHCASTAAGKSYGVAPEATAVAVQVLSCEGSGSSAGIFAGIEWAVKDKQRRGKPGILSMSLGGPGGSGYDDIMDYAMDNGMLVSVAAGNEHFDACKFSPAYVERAVTVGSTTRTDGMSDFSNYGECVDIFAPGSSITAAWIGDNTQTATISGTSMACPHVSGVAAQIMSEDPNLSADAVKEKLLCMSSPNELSFTRRARGASKRGKGTVNKLLYNGDDHSC